MLFTHKIDFSELQVLKSTDTTTGEEGDLEREAGRMAGMWGHRTGSEREKFGRLAGKAGFDSHPSHHIRERLEQFLGCGPVNVSRNNTQLFLP